MDKNYLTLDKLSKMLTDSSLDSIIIWAIPVMLSLVLLEYVISIYKNRKSYIGKDLLASASVGIGNLVISGLTKAFVFGIAIFFYNLTPWTIPFTWWSFVLCIIWLDFWRYISHRASHETRFLWATHIVHHSSEKYNFAVSFRLSWIQHIKLVFFIPVLMAGFHPVVFFICHQIEVLYQFWIHTEYIKKLPRPIEYIFTTPSHHRVHHARNEKYLDKNYGSTFIIWDRMFGTFMEEEETPEYGITVPVNSYNPIYLVFHEVMDITRDIFRSKNLKQAATRTFIRPSKLKEYEEKVKEQELERV